MQMPAVQRNISTTVSLRGSGGYHQLARSIESGNASSSDLANRFVLGLRFWNESGPLKFSSDEDELFNSVAGCSVTVQLVLSA